MQDDGEDGVHVKYMHQLPAVENAYMWPSVEDFSWEDKSSIVRVLPAPEIDLDSSSNRRQVFRFEADYVSQ